MFVIILDEPIETRELAKRVILREVLELSDEGIVDSWYEIVVDTDTGSSEKLLWRSWGLELFGQMTGTVVL